MRALVQLAVEKLHSELPTTQYDDTLFAHLVDEALGFERELRETLLYPQAQPATVFVLTQAHIFIKWINMEKKCECKKMFLHMYYMCSNINTCIFIYLFRCN